MPTFPPPISLFICHSLHFNAPTNTKQPEFIPRASDAEVNWPLIPTKNQQQKERGVLVALWRSSKECRRAQTPRLSRSQRRVTRGKIALHLMQQDGGDNLRRVSANCDHTCETKTPLTFKVDEMDGVFEVRSMLQGKEEISTQPTFYSFLPDINLLSKHVITEFLTAIALEAGRSFLRA